MNYENIAKIWWPIILGVVLAAAAMLRWYDKVTNHVETEEPKVEALVNGVGKINEVIEDVGEAMKSNAAIDTAQSAQIGEMVEQKMRDEERMKALCAMRNSGIPAVYCRNLEVQP